MCMHVDDIYQCFRFNTWQVAGNIFVLFTQLCEVYRPNDPREGMQPVFQPKTFDNLSFKRPYTLKHALHKIGMTFTPVKDEKDMQNLGRESIIYHTNHGMYRVTTASNGISNDMQYACGRNELPLVKYLANMGVAKHHIWRYTEQNYFMREAACRYYNYDREKASLQVVDYFVRKHDTNETIIATLRPMQAATQSWIDGIDPRLIKYINNIFLGKRGIVLFL